MLEESRAEPVPHPLKILAISRAPLNRATRRCRDAPGNAAAYLLRPVQKRLRALRPSLQGLNVCGDR